MIRILVLAFAALAVALCLAVAYVFVQEVDFRAANRQMETKRQKQAAASVAKAARAEVPPLPPAISEKEVAEIRWAAAPKPPSGTKDDYTWKQVEKILDDLRNERATRPQATNDLDAWYDYLASPDFTNSPDVPRHLEELEVWRKEMPDTPTPLVVIGKAHILHGWQARGGGYADTVTPEGARLFEERLTEAQKYLQQAVDLGAKDGEAIAAQIQVAKGRSLPKAVARGLLSQGMKTDPSYNGLYVAFAEYLLPRWYGEQGEVELLANDIAAELPGDDGLNALGQMAFIVNLYDPHTLFDGEYDRGLLAKAADVLVRRYAQDPNFVAFAALCAYVAQDHAACRRAQAFLSGDEEIRRVPNWEYHVRSIRPFCAARQVPHDETHLIWVGLSPSGHIGFDLDPRYIWCGNNYSDDLVRLLHVETGRSELALKGPRANLNGLALEPGRQWVACSYMNRQDDFGWCLWNTKSPEDPLVTKTKEPLRAIALSPTNEQLALGFGQRVDLMDLKTRKVTATIDLGADGKHRYVNFLQYSPDGKRIAVNELVADTSSGEKLFDLFKHAFAKPGKSPAIIVQRAIGFDAENRIMAVSHDVKARKVSLMRFSHDGQAWEAVIRELGERGHATAVSQDHQLFAIADGYEPSGAQGFTIWNLVSGKMLKHFGGHWQNIGHMTFSTDGKTLASIELGGGPIKFWSLEGLAEVETTSPPHAD